jgi:hypothetical protein
MDSAGIHPSPLFLIHQMPHLEYMIGGHRCLLPADAFDKILLRLIGPLLLLALLSLLAMLHYCCSRAQCVLPKIGLLIFETHGYIRMHPLSKLPFSGE